MGIIKILLPAIIAFIFVIFIMMRFKKINTSSKQFADNISYGISLGTLFGISIALSLKIDITYGISFGMLLGILMSTFYNKKNKE